MEMSSLTEQDFNVTVKATGKIDVPPLNRAKVNTFLGGYVKSTKLMVGDKVTKGQALLTLENSEYIDIQKDYLEVAEQINYLKSEYDRQKTLFDEKITSQKNYLKAESDYRRTKGIYLGLKEKLRLLNINPAQVEKRKLYLRHYCFCSHFRRYHSHECNSRNVYGTRGCDFRNCRHQSFACGISCV